MDFNRLPSRKYADEAAQQQRQRHAQQQQQHGAASAASTSTTTTTTTANARPHREQHGGVGSSRQSQQQSFIPPSSLLNQQNLPILPPLTSQMSSTSGSTKYSPGIETADKEEAFNAQPLSQRFAGSRTTTDDDVASSKDGVDTVVTPADSTAHLFRDTQGNVYHPSVTFAPSPSPRLNTLGLPSVSFDNSASSNHPGMGNRRGSSRAAEDGNAGGGFSGADFKRKRSLVRPDRERVNPDARHFHYAQHSAAFQAENGGRVGVSETGYGPTSAHAGLPYGGGQGGIASYGLAPGVDGRPGLRRGKSILAREEGMAAHESGLNFLKRGATLRRKGKGNSKEGYSGQAGEELLKSRSNAGNAKDPKQQDGEKAALTPWMLYCYAVTCCLPGVLLKSLGESGDWSFREASYSTLS